MPANIPITGRQVMVHSSPKQPQTNAYIHQTYSFLPGITQAGYPAPLASTCFSHPQQHTRCQCLFINIQVHAICAYNACACSTLPQRRCVRAYRTQKFATTVQMHCSMQPKGGPSSICYRWSLPPAQPRRELYQPSQFCNLL